MSAASGGAMEMVQSELNKYIAELEELSHRQENDVKPLSLWKVREAIYPCLKPIAEDTLAAPASQTFVEKYIFCSRTFQQWCWKPNVHVSWDVCLSKTEYKCTEGIWLCDLRVTQDCWQLYC